MEDSGLIVGPSWLCTEDASFDGLFTTVARKEGEVVCVYEGTVISTRDALNLEEKSYLMRLGEQCYIDARLPFKRDEEPEGNERECIARYINDSINPAGYNVVFKKQPNHLPYARALVIALRDIEAGEELFVNYGKMYWAGSRVKGYRIPFMDLHLARTHAIERAKGVHSNNSAEERLPSTIDGSQSTN